jgi:hypothetical protein
MSNIRRMMFDPSPSLRMFGQPGQVDLQGATR